MRRTALALPFILVGCANWYGTVGPAAERALASGDYASLADQDLCLGAWDMRRCGNAPLCATPRQEISRIRTEVNRRQLVSPNDWPEIEAGRVNLGMSGCAVLAAWGKPTLASESATVSTLAFPGGRAVSLRGGRVATVLAPP